MENPALEQERADNAKLLNVLRFAGVSAFFSLFIVLGGILQQPEWQGNLVVFAIYWALSAATWAGARRSHAVARLSSFAVAAIDVPAIFYLQWVQFPTSNAGGVAGFNLGVYVFMLVLATLALKRGQIFITAIVAIVFEGVLQHLAGISAGAIVAAAITLLLTAQACAYGSQRFAQLIEQVVLAEEQKAKSAKLAAIGQIVGSIGHDLRNPLAVISMAADDMRYRLERGPLATPEKLADSLGMIALSVTACDDLAAGLLDFAHERPLAPSACSPRSLAAEVLTLVQARTPASVQLVNEVPDVLPEFALDRPLLRRALVNLAQNAVEAIPPKRKDGVVRISGYAQDDGLVLVVADNGAGIPDDIRARIFEPLFTTKSRGTGFGLAVTHRAIVRHDATLTVDSKIDVGTTFTIVIRSSRV